MTRDEIIGQIKQHRIVAIIRGIRKEDVKKIAGALAKGGIKLLEVTMNSPEAIDSIAELDKNFGNDLLIGAGTVIEPAEVTKSIEAGAKFIISPSFDAEVIATTKNLNAVSIPGAFTPTEIIAAYKSGGDIIKIFPASIGPQYIKDIRGPFPHIPLMPTGGVSIENIDAYFKTGAVAAGIGSALVDARQEISEQALQTLSDRAAQFVKAAKNAA